MSQSVLVHPGSLQECLPGASWTLPGSQKTIASSTQRLLEDSDSFVVSLKLFQGVLECFGSLQKRPKASRSAPEVSRNVSEHPPAGSWHPSKCPKASQSVRPRLCQWPPKRPGRVWKGSTTDPNAQMSAHGSPVACFSLLHASASPCQNHSDHEHRQGRDSNHRKPGHPERHHQTNHKQCQGGIYTILLMTCNVRHSWH